MMVRISRSHAPLQCRQVDNFVGRGEPANPDIILNGIDAPRGNVRTVRSASSYKSGA